jgi:antitoxin MazE
MKTLVRSKLVRIGNSRGVRIPKPLLEQAGLEDEVDILVQGDKLIIQSSRKPRQDWEAHFSSMAKNSGDRLLDELTPTEWDDTEWTW